MRIEFNEVNSILTDNFAAFNNMSKVLGTGKNEIVNFGNDPQVFCGMAASAMGSYLAEVHGTTMSAWKECCTLFEAILENFIDDLSDVDSDAHAIIDSDYLGGLVKGASDFIDVYKDDYSCTNQFHNTYQKYLKSSVSSIGPFLSAIGDAQFSARQQAFDMSALDGRYLYSYNGVEQLLAAIEATCKTNYIQEDAINYKAGDFQQSGLMAKFALNDTDIDLFYRRFFNHDGSCNFYAFQQMLINNDGNLSDLEMRALAKLFSSEGISYDDIVSYCIGYGSYAIGEQEVLQGVAQELSAMIMTNAEGLLWKMGEYTNDEETQLNSFLRRAQLVTFLGSIDGASPKSFDLTGLDSINNGKIVYGGVDYPVSNIDELIKHDPEASFDNSIEATHNKEIANAKPDSEILGLIMDIISFIPYAGYATTPIDIGMNLSALINSSQLMSDADKAYALAMLDSCARRLGGNVAYVYTPEGYRSIGSTLSTDEALISIAGLQRDKGISLGDAIDIIQHKDNPRNQEIRDYLDGSDSHVESLRDVYEKTLKREFSDSFDYFDDKYGLSKLGYSKDSKMENLPLGVIQELITMEEDQH